MATDPHRTLRVVLLTSPTESMLRGIGRFAGTVRNCSFELLPPGPDAIRELQSEPPDGVIACIRQHDQAREMGKIGCPVVNHSGALRTETMAQVCCDSLAAGTLAAEHFLDLGFKNFAFLGDGEARHSRQRESGFRRRLRDAGHVPESLHLQAGLYPTRPGRSPEQDEALQRWLRDLPTGTAVFACNDFLGWWVTETAAAHGIRVPDELAVLGMDDHAVCLLSRPPLSSIRHPSERIGFLAASLLNDLMHGNTSRTEIIVAPRGLASRQSTDLLAVRDDRLSAGLVFIRAHFSEPIHVTDVAQAAGMNRRTLEKRFRDVLGKTPAQEIRRLRIEAARSLLAASDLPIDDVAERCGFSSRRWLSTVLAQATGLSPAAYRRSMRLPE